jgi:energy-coupling factor transporter ATP-binding protein EcfA2
VLTYSRDLAQVAKGRVTEMTKTIEQAILEWAIQRPPWQREVIGRLAAGEVFAAEEIKELATRVIGGAASFAELDPMVIPVPRSSDPSVQLTGIEDLDGVNALLNGQRLTIPASGLTIVFGNNGSGKSGYARLVKHLVRARHSEQVLADVFDGSRPAEPRATVRALIGGVETTIAWPEDAPADLSRISFYDEACGNTYIRTESEISYRPPALFLLDGLIGVCDGVRAEVDSALQANASAVANLPALPTATAAGKFLAGLHSGLTASDIDSACAVEDDVEERIEALADEEARLRVGDPEQERRRLSTIRDRLKAMPARLESELRRIETESLSEIRDRVEAAQGLRAAADLAASAVFSEELIDSVGSTAWRALWESARRYSLAQVYPRQPFPVTTNDARCVLCQQELDEPASDRLRRFEAFVQDDTQQRAESVEREVAGVLERLDAPIEMSADLASGVEALRTIGHDDVDAVEPMVARLEARRERFVGDLSTFDGGLDADVRGLVDRLRRAVEQVNESIDGLNQVAYDAELESVVRQREELTARAHVAEARDRIVAEVARIERRSELDEIRRSTATTGITTRAIELTREHVTDLVRDRFTRESDRLRLERVTLADAGGTKGALHHRPALVGAVREGALAAVLSEGEQTALGLAGFLTQVQMEQSGSAVVLDDPVCSLDHVRRGYVAARLAELAVARQVVVFTHDVAFVSELKAGAKSAGVIVAERSIERRGSAPGVCIETHPWKAKDVGERLGHLDAELARVKRERSVWTEEEYDKECAEWSGQLSETWERLVRVEIVDRVFDPSSLEVRPKMFRLLSKISEEDDAEFQAAYGRCSQWARRHDKSAEVNYVAPTIGEMEAESALIRAFWGRVKTYKN